MYLIMKYKSVVLIGIIYIFLIFSQVSCVKKNTININGYWIWPLEQTQKGEPSLFYFNNGIVKSWGGSDIKKPKIKYGKYNIVGNALVIKKLDGSIDKFKIIHKNDEIYLVFKFSSGSKILFRKISKEEAQHKTMNFRVPD